MEIKFKLDTNKAAKAAVAIAFSRVSLATDSPSLAAANALATIIVIAILYSPRLTSKKPV
jgi:hypothetical protein